MQGSGDGDQEGQREQGGDAGREHPSQSEADCAGGQSNRGAYGREEDSAAGRRSVTGAALRMLGVPPDAPVGNVILPADATAIEEES